MNWLVDALSQLYPWIKALHIAAVISWMAGMFYLPRLFVYHVERAEEGSQSAQTFELMEERLLRIIMRPAMLATWLFGLMLAFTPGVVEWAEAWPWVKTGSVIAMTAVHGWLSLQQKQIATGKNRYAGRTFRMVNEIPTVLMLIIVVMVVVRPF
ncbi:MAG: protoporphyrinogen oxidase HemJ [Rhodobacteraceae bacterium]|nr:protoporphyrinogen oxidase HemJ [Paracoccaceae bacterium]